MKDLTDLLPHILPYAPGCPVPVALEHIRSAVTDLCERTRLWNDTVSFTWAAGQNAITPPAGAVLHEVDAVRYGTGTNAYNLNSRSRQWLDDNWAGWREQTASQPSDYTQTVRNSLLLVPDLDADATPDTVEVDIYLKPANDCTQLPDFLIDQHWREIAWGALKDILVLPNQKFTNPDLAAFFAGKFQAKLDELADQNVKTQIRAPHRTKMRTF